MKHWTRRFTLQYTKVGQALNTSSSDINKDPLREIIRGIAGRNDWFHRE